jgi:hypothetical protein
LLRRFSDADFVGDVDARKSTTWVIFFLAKKPDHMAVDDVEDCSTIQL